MDTSFDTHDILGGYPMSNVELIRLNMKDGIEKLAYSALSSALLAKGAKRIASGFPMLPEVYLHGDTAMILYVMAYGACDGMEIVPAEGGNGYKVIQDALKALNLDHLGITEAEALMSYYPEVPLEELAKAFGWRFGSEVDPSQPVMVVDRDAFGWIMSKGPQRGDSLAIQVDYTPRVCREYEEDPSLEGKDLALLSQHGMARLEGFGYKGVLDRLVRSGHIRLSQLTNTNLCQEDSNHED
jgi:hypothetical protein